MLGHSHALSGLAAGAATLPWAPVHGTVAQMSWIAAAGGFAMLPDLDHRGSTVSDMWGPVTDVPSGIVGKLTGGHRWGTHDAVLAPLALGGLAILAADTYWASLLLMALAIGLALHALHFVIPGHHRDDDRRQHRAVVGGRLVAAGPQPATDLAALGGGARGAHPHRRGRPHDGRRSRCRCSGCSGGPGWPSRRCAPARSSRRPCWCRCSWSPPSAFIWVNTDIRDTFDPIVDRFVSSG